MEDKSNLFDVLKIIPSFMDNKSKIADVERILKILKIDECASAADSRAIRYF